MQKHFFSVNRFFYRCRCCHFLFLSTYCSMLVVKCFLFLAHHQISPNFKSSQENCASSTEHGQILALSNIGWYSLSACQLGVAQGSGRQASLSFSETL